MTTATRIALRRLRARHGVVAVVVALFVVFCGAAALAYWTTTGAGTATAGAATLSAPTAVTASAAGSTVTVNWTGVTPPGATLNGYYVTRYLGATPSNACGTNPTTPTLIPAGTLTCADTAVANGTYTYTVSAVFRTWAATSTASASVAVNSDPTPPTQAVTLLSGTGSAYLSGGTIYFNSAAAGNFTLTDAVSDGGSGPASARYPAVTATGWTHSLETVSTPSSGSLPTLNYTSSAYSWSPSAAVPAAHVVTGFDVAGNSVTTSLGFAADNVPPTGGVLVVNGGTATAPGAIGGYSTSGTFGGSRTDFGTDVVSGVASSVLTRAVATLSNGACGAYGTATVVPGAPSESTIATGCYRYTLTGTDNVGNSTAVSVVVMVDRTAPSVALTANGGEAFVSGTSVYYRGEIAGSATLTATVTDSASGPVSATFPAASGAGWNHTAQTVTGGAGALPTIAYTSSAYSWTASAAPAAAIGVTGADAAGNSGSATLNFVSDTVAPTGGALTVNAMAGSAAGTSSTSATGAWAVSTTAFVDTGGAGMATNVLTVETANLSGGAGGTCGTFSGSTVITGTTSVTGRSGGTCYRYVWTGTDNVGHVTTLSTTVKSSPYVVSVALQNGGGGNNVGRLEQNDRIVVTFSDAMDASTLCSAWTSDTTNYTLQGTDTLANLTDGGASSDTLAVSVASACGATGLHFGSLNLGSTGYNTTGTDIDFGRNAKPKRTIISWAYATKTLTIVFGDDSAPAQTVAGSSTFTYTPDVGVLNTGGVPIGGTLTSSGVLF